MSPGYRWFFWGEFGRATAWSGDQGFAFQMGNGGMKEEIGSLGWAAGHPRGLTFFFRVSFLGRTLLVSGITGISLAEKLMAWSLVQSVRWVQQEKFSPGL